MGAAQMFAETVGGIGLRDQLRAGGGAVWRGQGQEVPRQCCEVAVHDGAHQGEMVRAARKPGPLRAESCATSTR